MQPGNPMNPALQEKRCPRCGAELNGQAVGDHCANCMLQLALGPAGEVLAPTDSLASAGSPASPDLDDAIGQTIGRYKLLEKIGEGGCGVVYVAEQTEPVRRRVALKVIKLGMDTKQVVARFEAERQALALMDHPNIAKVLDAGTTGEAGSEISNLKSQIPKSEISDLKPQIPGGRPYFVMELVRGIRITDFCEQEKLSTRQRLDLFIKVCQAIQHAHQKGIIHRDIKPANILVTLHDGVPVPKVIDFGIAKATEGRLTDATVYTQLHQFIGTPAYMSPEQAEMSGLDIDTRSDIYSLGVLLYELLTGQTPFDTRQLMSSGLDAFRKAIREQEPPRPSTRLTQKLVAADVSPRHPTAGVEGTKAGEINADSRRRLRLREQIAQLRGDLDWIVMKCLEKDRARRYETANGLATDIQRHLHNEPVNARPPSAAYRFQKAWRRNKLVYSAAIAIAAAMIIGLTISLWQTMKAQQARDNEAAQRTKAEIAEQRSEKNAREATASLYDSLLGQARATRVARQVGYRETAFALLQKARDLETPVKTIAALRHEAVACMGDFVGFQPRRIASARSPDAFGGMELSPDGRVVALATVNGEIILQELPSGRELGRWQTDSHARSMAFNRTGDRLISVHIPYSQVNEGSPGGRKGDSPPMVTEFAVDLSGQWRPLNRQPMPGAFLSLALGNSMCVAVAADERRQEIHFIEFSSGQTLHRLRRSTGSWNSFARATRDGSTLALAQSPDAEHPEVEIELWDLPSGKMIRRSRTGVGATATFALNADGHHLLMLGEKGSRIFKLPTFDVADQLSGYGDEYNRASFLAGTTLLVLPRPQQRRFLIRDFAKHETVATFQEQSESMAATFAPRGEYLLTLSFSELNFYHFRAAEECLTVNGHPVAVTGLAFSPDGRQLASVSKDRTLRLWDAGSGQQLWEGDKLLPGLGQAVDFSPDGQLIGTGIWATPLVQLWNAATGRQLRQLTNEATFTWSLRFVPASSNSLVVISGGVRSEAKPHAVGMWRIRSSREVLDGVEGSIQWDHSRPPAGMLSLVVSPDASHIAFLHEAFKSFGQATIQDPWGRTAPRTLGRLASSVQTLAFTPTGESLVALTADNRVCVYDLSTLEPQRSFDVPGPSTRDRLIALSPSGKWLAVSSASNRGVDIYDFATGKLRYPLPDREGTVYWLSWHPKEPRLAVARDNGDVSIWDLGKVERQLVKLGLGFDSEDSLAVGDTNPAPDQARQQ